MDSIQSLNMVRTAIIDCGTNTFNLLVVEHDDHHWTPLFSNKIPVKIGEGGFENKLITPNKMVRAIDVLHHYQEVCSLWQVQQVKVVATSAVRDAQNNEHLKQMVKKYVGWEMEIISGEEEASLIYEGIRNTGVIGQQTSLLMDIGGGSTEWIIANDEEVFWKKSYPLGVSRLFEQLQPEERLSAANMQALKKILDDQLWDLKEAMKQFPCQQLIGASGSFDTLLDIFRSAHLEPLKEQNEHFQEIPMTAFPAIHLWLMGSTLKERYNHPAIPTLRAEYLPMSSWMVKYVIEMAQVKKMYRSAYALKEGLIKTILKQSN